MNSDIHNNILRLTQKIGYDSDVSAVYLFGSYAGGKQNINSDIDLAVLLALDFPPDRYFEKKLDLLALASAELETDDVDLVILNQVPPALAYRVFSRGKLLLEKGGQKDWRVSFQAGVCDRYFDFKQVEKIIFDGLARRIREGRFGG